MLRIGRVRLDMDVVAQWTVGAIEELDNAEAFVHGLEERSVPLLAVRKRGLGSLQLGVVVDRELAQPRVLRLKRPDAALQLFGLDQTHGHPPCGTAKTAVVSGM